MARQSRAKTLEELRANRNARLHADPTCSKCGVTKTVADFPAVAVDYWCSECRREYAIKAYHRKRALMAPDELAKVKARINRNQNRRRARRLAAMPETELVEFRARINADNLSRRDGVRDACYAAYGGYVCACCGETERSFLSIDHINEDGAEHKKRANLKTTEQIHRWLIRHNFPPGFQVLCMNCQWGKRKNGGICPHKSKV